MTVKYQIVGRDYPNLEQELSNITHENWQDYLEYKRFPEKEKALADLLGLKEDEEFILINENFAKTQKRTIDRSGFPSDIRVVEMQTIGGFSLFDWSGLIERAKAIYVADSAVNYLIEKLETTDDLHIYARAGQDTKTCLEQIFNKKYTWY